jgi:hypothetical protein
MSSTTPTPQPVPQMPPPLDSLAPPLSETKTTETPPLSAPPAPPKKDESWMPVEVQAESLERTTKVNTVSTVSTDERVATGSDQGPTLLSRVMKQRSSVLPQSAHVQKDNTLAIFVTLCLVVVAIACGIYFVADRETQESDHVTTATAQSSSATSAGVSQIPPPAASVQKTTAPSINPLFGKPVPPTHKPAVVHKPAMQDKATQMVQRSQTQLSRMQYIEAEYSARQATKQAPTSADAWLALGRALYGQGRYAEAKQALTACVKRAPESKTAKSAADYISSMSARSM